MSTSRLPRILGRLVAGLGVAALLLGAVELLLRLTVPRDKLLFTFEKPNGLFYYESSGKQIMRPNHVERVYDGPYVWTAQVNGQGLRESAELPFERPKGEERWLALGDSWIFGLNANQGMTLPDQLERLLPPVLGGSVQVINAGQTGSGSFDMVRQWASMQAFELDGVLLGLPHNTSRQQQTSAERQAWYKQVPGAPAFDSRLYLALRRGLIRYTRPTAPKLNADDLEQAIEDLSLIAEEARGRGLPVTLMLWPAQINEPIDDAAMARVVRALRPLGVKFAGLRLEERACWGYSDIYHPSEAGYLALAERVLSLWRDGEADPVVGTTPTCAEVDAPGPGKPGAYPAESGPPPIGTPPVGGDTKASRP